MNSDIQLLLEHQTDIQAAIAGSRLSEEVQASLLAHLQRTLAGANKVAATLARANAERHDLVHDGIHRAADKFLTPSFRKVANRRAWASSLLAFLSPRHAEFGLQRAPNIRTIRRALINWAPPIGHAQIPVYASTRSPLGGCDEHEGEQG